VKIWGLDGKLVRSAEFVSPKNRAIFQAALLDSKTLLTANESEKSQERYVLAKYDLATLTRTEIGTLDGQVGELAPGNESLFYTFSPSGAAGYNSRVYYAYDKKL
jgi:hypothetical protein